MDTVGNRIKQLRKQSNQTQIEFSKKICISQSHLSKIENDEEKPSKAVVKLISIIFKVDENWLTNVKTR